MRAPKYIYQDYNESDNSDDEFAEYMWMEDIDNFDKQVLQELAEEDEMEECMEEMLAEEEARETVFYQGQQQHHHQQVTGNNMYMGNIPYRLQGVYYQQTVQQPLYEILHTTNGHIADDILARSNLNPCAKEFVPGCRVTTNNSRETSEESSSDVTER